MKTGLLLACLFLTLASCTQPIEPLHQNFQFPLAAGNRWSYTRRVSITNFKPLITGATFSDTTIIYPASVTIEGITQLNGIPMWKFRFVETEDQRTFIGYSFYVVDRDTLFSRAYDSPLIIRPAQENAGRTRFRFNGKSYSSIHELMQLFHGDFPAPRQVFRDSIMYEDGPVKSFVYPFVRGQAWDYRTPDFIPYWRIRKTVRGTNIFTIGTIPYFANQIHWDYDLNADGNLDSTLIADEWVGTAGILERKFIAKVVISTPYYPEGIGTADYVDDYLCTSLSVK